MDSPLAGGSTRGRDAIEHVYATYFRAFTDFRLEQDDLLIDGDRVALFATRVGHRPRGLHGHGARRAGPSRFSIVFLYELRDGLIVRDAGSTISPACSLQIGMLKAKPS